MIEKLIDLGIISEELARLPHVVWVKITAVHEDEPEATTIVMAVALEDPDFEECFGNKSPMTIQSVIVFDNEILRRTPEKASFLILDRVARAMRRIERFCGVGA